MKTIRRKVTSKQLIRKNRDSEILDMSLKGFSVYEIANRLNISRKVVLDTISESMSDLNARISEKAEIMAMVEIARLESLQRKLYGLILDSDNPDLRLINSYVKISSEKRAWVESQQRQFRRSDDQAAVNIERLEITFSSDSSHYKKAIARMDESWIQDADMAIHELYLPSSLEQSYEEAIYDKKADE